MKLNDNSLYLSLALRSLQATVVPDLHSPAAKDAAGLIGKCLEQLLARANCDPATLSDTVAKGDALAARLAALARARGVAVGAGAARDDASITSFEHFAAAHAALCARLAALANALSRARGDNGVDAGLSALLREAAQWEADAHAALLQPPKPETETTTPSLTREALEAFIQDVHPDGAQARVTAFDRVPGGFGKQTYMITLCVPDGGERQLIVRKNDPVPLLLHGGSRLDREFHYVRAVAATGYPAPRPLWFGKNVPGVDADFYIMERLPGRIPSSYLGGDKVPETVALELAEHLARLHQMGPRDLPECVAAWEDPALLEPGDTVEACNRRIIASWRHYAGETLHPPSPMLEYLLDWLETHVPRDTRAPVLMHGDYNVHNVLADEGRITGVLDWEVVGFGAPEQDIGYIKPTISQHIAWDRFYDRYLACGGRSCEFDSLNYYQAFGAMRVLFAGGRANSNLDAGVSRDIRYVIFELGLNPQFMSIALDNTAKLCG